MNFDEALQQLYGAQHQEFVGERKRLAAELKRAGDKPGAARIAGLTRPPLSAWVVNQLFRQAPTEFQELFESTRRVRSGALAAAADARECTLRLKGRAASLLGAAGHAATEATLRRVTTNLAALAAAGSFDPDLPGALSADREPPGFDGTALVAWSEHVPTTVDPPPKAHTGPIPAKQPQGPADDERPRRDSERLAAEARAEAARLAAEARAEAARLAAEARARRQAELERLTAALTSARQDCAKYRAKLELLRADLTQVETALAESVAAADDIERQLEQLAAADAPRAPDASPNPDRSARR